MSNTFKDKPSVKDNRFNINELLDFEYIDAISNTYRVV